MIFSSLKLCMGQMCLISSGELLVILIFELIRGVGKWVDCRQNLLVDKKSYVVSDVIILHTWNILSFPSLSSF